MQDHQSIIALLEKHRAGTISDEEKAMLEAWYNKAASSTPLSDAEVQESLRRIGNRLPLKRPSIWPKLAVAATTLLLAGGLLYYYKPVPKETELATKATDSTKVTLQTAGRTITLNTRQKGIIIKGKEVLYKDGGKITDQQQYMTLRTPRGAQYQITLPDGTQVWLNAATKLTWPGHFEGNTRVVELEGEAYFEVSKDIHPFIVKSRQQEVTVLGTAFNIMAYQDEPFIATSLIAGSVKVNDMLLKPGFEARNTDGNLELTLFDLKAVSAWREGLFYFKNANLKTVLHQLQRWYDIEIEDSTKRTGDEFTGQIEQNKPLEKVLEILQLSGVNCKMEGRRLIVY